jgi:small-conductance mechanosensitive channel
VVTDIARAFREAGIEIPFPQRDLHVRSIDTSAQEALAGKHVLSSIDTAKTNTARLTPPDPAQKNRTLEEK